MAIVPLFTGRVSETGRLAFDKPAVVLKHIARLAGKPVQFSIRLLRSKRSLQQNRWLFGVAYQILAEEWGYERDEIEMMHYGLVAKYAGTHFDERLGVEVPNARSSKWNTREFGDYMEWLVRYAAQSEPPIYVPLPNEVDLDAIDEAAA
jgi:hypothetical protein